MEEYAQALIVPGAREFVTLEFQCCGTWNKTNAVQLNNGTVSFMDKIYADYLPDDWTATDNATSHFAECVQHGSVQEAVDACLDDHGHDDPVQLEVLFLKFYIYATLHRDIGGDRDKEAGGRVRRNSIKILRAVRNFCATRERTMNALPNTLDFDEGEYEATKEEIRKIAQFAEWREAAIRKMGRLSAKKRNDNLCA